jgi:hypothetical protein
VTKPHTSRRAVAVQVAAGIIVGPVMVWALLNNLPLESGRSAVAVSAAVTLGVATLAWAQFPRFRVAALTSGVAAAAISTLVAVVVAT